MTIDEITKQKYFYIALFKPMSFRPDLKIGLFFIFFINLIIYLFFIFLKRIICFKIKMLYLLNCLFNQLNPLRLHFDFSNIILKTIIQFLGEYNIRLKTLIHEAGQHLIHKIIKLENSKILESINCLLDIKFFIQMFD